MMQKQSLNLFWNCMAKGTRRDLFQLIDLDRTIFSTSLFIKKICDIVDEYMPGLGNEIDKQFKDAYKREETFFALEYIRQTLGRDQYEAMVDAAMKRIDKNELLLPGAKERLALAETLSDKSPGYGILTYSLYPEDQYLKVKLAGLEHIAMYIIDSPNKAELLATWQTDDGKFQLPEAFGGGVVDELTLEDDKLRAFFNLPEKVTGVWLTQYDDADQRIAALGLKNLIAVSHLDDSSVYLQNRFNS